MNVFVTFASLERGTEVGVIQNLTSVKGITGVEMSPCCVPKFGSKLSNSQKQQLSQVVSES